MTVNWFAAQTEHTTEQVQRNWDADGLEELIFGLALCLWATVALWADSRNLWWLPVAQSGAFVVLMVAASSTMAAVRPVS